MEHPTLSDAAPTTGLLDLLLLRGRGFSSKVRDLVVVIEQGEMKFESICANSDGTWNQPFRFAVRGPEDSLVFKVRSDGLLKTKFIGSATVVQAELAHNVKQTHWFVLDSGGEIEIAYFFLPKELPNIALMHSGPRLRVSIDCPNHWPGDCITGSLLYISEKAEVLHDVILGIFGETIVKWQMDDGIEVTEFRKMDNHLAVARSARNIDALGAEEHVWHPGVYIWEFSYRLPIAIPPSWESRYSHTSYFVEAKVKTKEGLTRDRVKEKFIMRAMPPLPLPDDPPIRKGYSDAIHLEANVPKVIYIGEPFEFDFKIHNNSPQAIDGVTVELKVKEVFSAATLDKHTGKSKNKKQQVVLAQFGGRNWCPPQSKRVEPLRLTLGSDIRASVLPQQSKYAFRELFIKIVTKAGKQATVWSSIDVPIFLCHTERKEDKKRRVWTSNSPDLCVDLLAVKSVDLEAEYARHAAADFSRQSSSHKSVHGSTASAPPRQTSSTRSS